MLFKSDFPPQSSNNGLVKSPLPVLLPEIMFRDQDRYKTNKYVHKRFSSRIFQPLFGVISLNLMNCARHIA